MFEESTESLTIPDEGTSRTGKTQDSTDATKLLNSDPLPELESFTTRIFNLLSDFKGLSDRACVAALRKTESADRLEESMVSAIITLRNQLAERDEDLQAKDKALKRLDTRWRAKFEQLEIRTHNKAIQQSRNQSDLVLVQSQAPEAGTRLGCAELPPHSIESRRGKSADDLEAEIAALKLQLLSRTACFQEKELSIKKTEQELRARVQHQLIRIQETEAKLAVAEAELEHNRIIIENAALRESEIFKLMGRLSSECERLSEELRDKIELIAHLEEKNQDHPAGGKVWKRVIGLEQPL